MQPLIDQLTSNRDICPEQATGILSTIKEFIEENFPAFGNSFDEILTPQITVLQIDTLPTV